jgi:starch synthase
MIEVPLKRSIEVFKRKNKEWLCNEFGLDPNKALISFIGRFAGEKGADLLPGLGYEMNEWKLDANFFVLGSGDPSIEHALNGLNLWLSHRFQGVIAYNEALAHRIYAGSDFLVMPSRVEPCGLNQMYAMRYGTIPIVRKIGGLKDSVEQYEKGSGTGFFFEDLYLRSILHTFQYALSVYENEKEFKALRQRAIDKDYSWDHSAETYKQLYEKIL